MIKVLHILNELKSSGAEVMLNQVCSVFSDNDIESHIMATTADVGPYANTLEESGHIIHHLRFSKSPMYFLRFYRFIKDNDIDLVHIHREGASFYFFISTFLAGAVCVRTVHNCFAFTGKLRLFRKFQRQLSAKLGMTYVTIGASVEENEKNAFGMSSRRIDNWIETDRFKCGDIEEYKELRQSFDVGANTMVFTSVGNCSHIKNHTAIIAALKRLADDGQDFVYFHIGEEEPGNPEQDYARSLGLAEKIRFLGRIENPLSYLKAADICNRPGNPVTHPTLVRLSF